MLKQKLRYLLLKSLKRDNNKIENRSLDFAGKNFDPYYKDLLGNVDTNQLIVDRIVNNEPFMLTRIGALEMKAVNNHLVNKLSNYTGLDDPIIEELFTHSGVFPATSEIVSRFCDLYITGLRDADLIGVWNNVGENTLINLVAPKAELTALPDLEPFFHDNPWSKYLENKKVLVIHPFEETVIAQYKKREQLFDNGILPFFHLKTVKAVQSLSAADSRFETWFDTYEWTLSQIDKEDYDVAIIGAGAYGLPIAAHVKNKGKIAIHLGGASQLLFGIKGKRWESIESYKPLINENWCYPAKEEKPSFGGKVDGIGPYWS